MFVDMLIFQETPAERTVIYNRRAPSASPMYYADDSLEAELNMGKDIKIQTEGNDSSSVASYELVFQYHVYLLEPWQSTVLLQLEMFSFYGVAVWIFNWKDSILI